MSLANSSEPIQVQMLPAEKKRIPLSHRLGVKISAFLLGLVMVFTILSSGILALWMLDEDLYSLPQETYLSEKKGELALEDAIWFTELSLQGSENYALSEFHRKNLSYVCIKDVTTDTVVFEAGSGDPDSADAYRFDLFAEIQNNWIYVEEIYVEEGTSDEGVRVLQATVLPLSRTSLREKVDGYAILDALTPLAYALRFWIFAIALGALLVGGLCLIFLLYASGRKKGKDAPSPGWGTLVPWDLLLAALLSAAVILLEVCLDADRLLILLIPVIGTLFAIPVVGFCMSLSLRLKLGIFWSTTVVGWFLKILWRFVCKLGRLLLRATRTLVDLIPFVWKVLVVYLAASLGTLILIVLWGGDSDMVFLLLMERLCLFPLLCYFLWVLLRLKKGAEDLSGGDLDTPVDTRGLIGVFRSHGQRLNSLGEGLNCALEQRMKSERMKTELITNVSHDLKTPLTSIINYADLIAREECDNENITRYAEVLSRQSVKMKRLIDDLVEVSKATSGAMEMHPEPLDVEVLLLQLAGEYEPRLTAADLELRTKKPEYPVRILADGRRLWRVFDNLMNNICKYAQKGTRVYLSLEEQDSRVVITFKNISAMPLELREEELFERFTRGDASRSSEGSGLGLSIARSLTELQGGCLSLHLDGDLFKAVLTFPLYAATDDAVSQEE